VTASGTRAAELALRLKYAGVPGERIVVEPNVRDALERALADHDQPVRPLYAIPTYTAMLELRDLLRAGAHVQSSWA
jgi:hypothetical protein